MKKFTAIFCTLNLIDFVHSYAQNFYVGINGGYLKNTKVMKDDSSVPLYWDEGNEKKRVDSYSWGLQLGYNFSKRWGVETQLLFSNEGLKEKKDLLCDFHIGNISGVRLAEIEWRRNYYYMRIPLLVHCNFMPAGYSWKIKLSAGCNVGILYKQSSEYLGLNELGKEVLGTLNFDDYPLKKIDAGLQAGIRVQKSLHKYVNVFLDGSVYKGFSNIINMPDIFATGVTPSYYFENIINRHVLIMAGLQCNLWNNK